MATTEQPVYRGLLSAWRWRVAAELIDFAIVAVLANCILLVLGASPWWTLSGVPDSTSEIALWYGTASVAALLYYPAFMSYTNGQSVGKYLLHIRVIRTNGQNMSVGLAAWREVALKFVLLQLINVIPLAGFLVAELVFLADGLWPLWDYEKRALHDMLAGTRVISVATSEAPLLSAAVDE
jgi:uncharacterized RDD family membrane protein YckC